MRIGIITDGNLAGTNHDEKLHELLREAQRADELGFHCWGTSETHFVAPNASVSAPDALYGAVAVTTDQIIIRYMAMVTSLHNPISVFERLATLDVLSRGRAELCTARGNNKLVMQGFGVKPEETRERWQESLNVIGDAFRNDSVSSTGKFWPFEEVTISPRPIQASPRLYSVSSGPESHKLAAENGIGVLGFDNFLGWDFLEECIEAYRTSIPNATPANGVVNNTYGLYVAAAHCSTDRGTAIAENDSRARGFVQGIIDLYAPLAKEPSYEYFDRVNQVNDLKDDIPRLMTTSPSIMAGTPDDIIESLKKAEALDIDEVILTIDAISHDKHMSAIELIGKHVLPEFHKD